MGNMEKRILDKESVYAKALRQEHIHTHRESSKRASMAGVKEQRKEEE